MSCKYNNCKHCGYKSECEIYKENAELKERNRELEAQIEKMKCCENCAFFKEKTYQICLDIKKQGSKKCAFYKII